MRRFALLAAALLMAPLGCSTASKTANTTVKGAETAGTATWESAKTAGGTTRGLVTGGTTGAKEEYETGKQETKAKTREKADETKAAAHPEENPAPADSNPPRY